MIVWLMRLRLWRSRSMSIAAVVAPISRNSTSLPFLSSLVLPVPDCSFYTVTTYVRCYAPWYKSVIQFGVGLYGIHNLGPAALGSVYPVETSTSLYNLYLFFILSLSCHFALFLLCFFVFLFPSLYLSADSSEPHQNGNRHFHHHSSRRCQE